MMNLAGEGTSTMSGGRSIWVPNSPEPLLKLATRFCIRHKKVFTEKLSCGSLKLVDSLFLPLEISEALLETCNEEKLDIDNNFTNIFADLQNTRIRHLNLRNSSVTDSGIRCLVGHNLRKIHLHGCDKLTTQTLEYINSYSDNLLSLSTSCTAMSHVFPDFLSSPSPDSDTDSETDEEENNEYARRRYILRAPRLRSLCLRDLYVMQGKNYFNILLKALPNLTHLDLSGVMHSQNLRALKFLLNCPGLVFLILHNVKEVKSALSTICQMKGLEYLDISQYDELHGDFDDPCEYLEQVARSLPRLRCLDISGTNLDWECLGKGRSDDKLCDIPALACRTDNPLEFLGLYRTVHKASRREHIPARTVSGTFTEEQVLVAARRYHDRCLVMECVLEDLLDLVRNETCRNLQEVLDVTMLAMEEFVKEKKIQRYASALLYYLLPLKGTAEFNVAVKKRMVGVVLDTMQTHKTDTFMMRNGCMVLWQFQVPQDLLYQYERVVDILLSIGERYQGSEQPQGGGEGGSYVQRAAVFLLNSLICQVSNEQKATCGEKIVDVMLRIVRTKLELNLCDDVMETAWSAMWNVTDETPGNSARFLDKAGMELFLKCKETFPTKLDLLKNMMGLLGNVAEVQSCRKRLMTPEFVEEFSFLLDSKTDGIEVSYNAAGVISHIASDGEEAWTIHNPSRSHVLERLNRAVNRWDLASNRNINYRSLCPIIDLLSVKHTTECQLWATWAIANLTRFDQDKYCPLVQEEGGVRQIKLILDHISQSQPTELMEKLLRLCKISLANIETWNKKQELRDVGEMEDMGEIGGIGVSGEYSKS